VRLSEEFRRAASDYIWLLARAYPEASCRQLVGDRYQLNTVERRILYRGVAGQGAVPDRLAKQRNVIVDPLYVDGLNVVYTVSAYLLGVPVFVATDGYLRDALESHGASLDPGILARAASLMARSAGKAPRVLLDETADFAVQVAQAMTEAGFADVSICAEVDGRLIRSAAGSIATSDSGVIDRCTLPVFDLARASLGLLPDATFVDLRSLQ
jgi:hypothetical protein